MTLNGVIAITLRNFTEFGGFWDGHDMEVFMCGICLLFSSLFYFV